MELSFPDMRKALDEQVRGEYPELGFRHVEIGGPSGPAGGENN